MPKHRSFLRSLLSLSFLFAATTTPAEALAETELGAVTGGHFFDGNNSVGVPGGAAVATSPRDAPLLGVRLGWFYHHHRTDRWYSSLLGAEGEVGLVPTDSRTGNVALWIATYRAHAVVQFRTSNADASLVPFVLFGGGATQILDSKDAAVLRRGVVGFPDVGIGLKYELDDAWGLRADGRLLLPPTVEGAGFTHDYETLFSFYKISAEAPRRSALRGHRSKKSDRRTVRGSMYRLAFCILILFLVACGSPASAVNASADAPSTNKEKAIQFLKSIETGDTSALAYAGAYKQHDSGIPDGVAGLQAVLAQLPKGSAKVRTVRALADGDYVVTHTEYDFFGPKIGFDVFRFENGKIAEHWDNLQETPKGPNPSGHRMTDGPTELTDLDATQANKKLVSAFVDDILLGGRMDRIGQYCDGDRYVQHNPLIADGVAALGGALQALAKQGKPIKYGKVHKVLGEGNFVLVMSEGTFGDAPTAYYDLFRIEAGKVAEHWDVIEAIPPKAEWKNTNGKF